MSATTLGITSNRRREKSKSGVETRVVDGRVGFSHAVNSMTSMHNREGAGTRPPGKDRQQFDERLPWVRSGNSVPWNQICGKSLTLCLLCRDRSRSRLLEVGRPAERCTCYGCFGIHFGAVVDPEDANAEDANAEDANAEDASVEGGSGASASAADRATTHSDIRGSGPSQLVSPRDRAAERDAAGSTSQHSERRKVSRVPMDAAVVCLALDNEFQPVGTAESGWALDFSSEGMAVVTALPRESPYLVVDFHPTCTHEPPQTVVKITNANERDGVTRFGGVIVVPPQLSIRKSQRP